MLTRDEIEHKIKLSSKLHVGYRAEFLRPIIDQALLAIDLAAENEQLKRTNTILTYDKKEAIGTVMIISETCADMGEKIRILESQLAAAQKKMDEIRGFANDHVTTHCYTPEAQIGYDTAKTLVLRFFDDENDDAMITIPRKTHEFMVRHVKRVDGLVKKLDEIRAVCYKPIEQAKIHGKIADYMDGFIDGHETAQDAVLAILDAKESEGK